MKHLKSFENTIEPQPQIGDYVICKDSLQEDNDISDFIDNNIGKFVKYTNKNDEVDPKIYPYLIKYTIPKSLTKNLLSNEFSHCKNIKNCRGFAKSEIIHFSPSKEDLEIYINATKYNL